MRGLTAGYHQHLMTTAAFVVAVAAASPAMAQTRSFDVPAEAASRSIPMFARQAGVQILAGGNTVRSKRTNAVKGSYSVEEGLRILLRGTGLAADPVDPSTGIITIRAAGQTAEGEGQAGSAAAENESVDAGATPEILVVGQRTINADIRRTENDVQPYVVFNQEDVRRSQVTTLEDFLKNRLPMNSSQATRAQTVSTSNVSSINLRGLGPNQTLILLDGRRLPSSGFAGRLDQPDLNGVPLASIERIEVLPSTASGIYGGGATGGVINIITRRDYSGIDLRASVGGSFRGDSGQYRLDASAGFNLGPQTHLVVSGSRTRFDGLRNGDRDFTARARALLLANNPSAFFSSALAPPLGYTSNIVSQNGANLVLKPQYGGTALNSPFTSVPVGYAGPSTDNAAALVANAGRYNLDIPDTLDGSLQSLLNSYTINSFSANIRHQFSRSIEAFVDFGWFENKGRSFSGAALTNPITLAANAPNNPFTTAVRVTFPYTSLAGAPYSSDSTTLRATGGLIFRLGHDWSAGLDYSWNKSRADNTSATALVGDPDGTGPLPSATASLQNGTLNVLRDLNAFPLGWGPYLLPIPNAETGPFVTVQHDVTARISGPLFHLPGGPVVLTSLAEWRQQRADDSYQDSTSASSATSVRFYPARRQTIGSLYGEVRAPLVSAENSLPLVSGFELQGSVRYDRYATRLSAPAEVAGLASRDDPLPSFSPVSNEVSATKFTVGLRYQPIPDITIRASYGTGFLPPAVDQLVRQLLQGSPTSRVIDPKRGGVSAPIGPHTRDFGGNPDLEPENSRSWSLGLILNPRFVPGFRASLDYTNIHKTNEIASLSAQQAVDLEDIIPGVITRGPLTDEDRARGFTAGPITNIDIGLRNLRASSIEAYDVQLDYQTQRGPLGQFHPYAIFTYQPRLVHQTVPTAPAVNDAGFTGGPLKWRGNFGVDWSISQWTVNWNGQYFGGYSICSSTSPEASCSTLAANQGAARVRSQLYNDLLVSYTFDGRFGRGLSGLEVSLGIQNIFDRRPPIVAEADSSGGYSTYGDPRLRRFEVTLRKHF